MKHAGMIRACICAGAAVVCATSALGAQGARLLQAPGGQALVVSAKAIRPTATPTRPLSPPREPESFRPVSATVVSQLLQAAGEPPLAAPAANPTITLTARSPWAEGRAVLQAFVVSNFTASDFIRAEPASGSRISDFTVWKLPGLTATRYMVQYQVREENGGTDPYKIWLPDGSSVEVPALAQKTQDILVLVQLADGSGSVALTSLFRPSGKGYAFLGVQVTPM